MVDETSNHHFPHPGSGRTCNCRRPLRTCCAFAGSRNLFAVAMSESHGALLDDAVSIDAAEDAATASEADPHAEAVAGNGEVATGHDDDDDDDDDERDWKRKRRSDDGGDDDAGRDQPYRGAGPDKRQRTRYTAGAESGATESAPPSAGAGAGAGAGGDLGAQDEDTSSSAPDMPPPGRHLPVAAYSQPARLPTCAGTCVKLRGLPYTATADDVRSFLKGCDVKTVVLCHNSTCVGAWCHATCPHASGLLTNCVMLLQRGCVCRAGVHG